MIPKKKTKVKPCGCYREHVAFVGSWEVECDQHKGLQLAMKMAARWARGQTLLSVADEFGFSVSFVQEQIKRAQDFAEAEGWEHNPYVRRQSELVREQ